MPFASESTLGLSTTYVTQVIWKGSAEGFTV
jgi:hypothetical protein